MAVDLVVIPPEILDEDEEITPRIEALISRFVRAGIARVRVAVPGVALEDVNPATGTITVRPAVADVFPDEFILPEALPNLPVRYPSGGGHSVTVPIKKDDPVVISFCDREIRRWIREGSAVVSSVHSINLGPEVEEPVHCGHEPVPHGLVPACLDGALGLDQRCFNAFGQQTPSLC